MRPKLTIICKKTKLSNQKIVGFAMLLIATIDFFLWKYTKNLSQGTGQIDDAPIVISFMLVIGIALILNRN